MNDRELLEMAAKAAEIGPKLCYESARNCLRIGDRKSYWLWSPLTNDGDALRLASKIMLTVEFGNNCVIWPIEVNGEGHDPLIATRRAIVRAAAEIGRTMTTESVR